jgi:peptidase C-terminal domain protein
MSQRFRLAMLSICAFFAISECLAEGQSLYLYLKSGTEIVLPLSSAPIISFDNGTVTAGNYQYRFEDVDAYRFDARPTSSIEVIGIDKGTIIFDSKGRLTLSEIYDKNDISLYDMDGRSIPCEVSNTDNKTTVNFTATSAGIYILKIGNKSIKLRKS